MVEVSQGGGHGPANLVALCPTCHALFHRGTISWEAIYSWKGILVALNQAFDKEAIDNLLFLVTLKPSQLLVSGDGVLRFSRLIAADLATFRFARRCGANMLYEIAITTKGKVFVEAWKAGNRDALATALSPGQNSTISAQEEGS